MGSPLFGGGRETEVAGGEPARPAPLAAGRVGGAGVAAQRAGQALRHTRPVAGRAVWHAPPLEIQRSGSANISALRATLDFYLVRSRNAGIHKQN